jgi:hypothetical protein
MHHGKVIIVATFALALLSGACNRDVDKSRDTATSEDGADSVDRAAELQRERTDEIARLNMRVTDIEREYGEKNQKV